MDGLIISTKLSFHNAFLIWYNKSCGWKQLTEPSSSSSQSRSSVAVQRSLSISHRTDEECESVHTNAVALLSSVLSGADESQSHTHTHTHTPAPIHPSALSHTIHSHNNTHLFVPSLLSLTIRLPSALRARQISQPAPRHRSLTADTSLSAQNRPACRHRNSCVNVSSV